MTDEVKRFDRRYFDRWYRSRRHRVATPAEIRRRALLAISIAEFVLGRPMRSVLDVGCGEGSWRAPLLRLRPRLRYRGVDASEYVVERFGRSRSIRLGTVGKLGDLGLRRKYDVVICADVLHYLGSREVEQGLDHLVSLLGGIAYLPTFTSADDVDGDVRAVRRRSPRWYRSRITSAGLVPLGLDFYLRRSLATTLSALELPAGL